MSLELATGLAIIAVLVGALALVLIMQGRGRF